MKGFIFFWLFCISVNFCIAQSRFICFPIISENERRIHFLNEDSLSASFFDNYQFNESVFDSIGYSNGLKSYFIPLYSISKFNSSRPYGWGDMLMIPNVGFQQYLSTGILVNFKFFNFQFQPEFVWAQNKTYQGFPTDLTSNIYLDRYFGWNRGDFPETLSDNFYSKFWWGQSKISVSFGAFETGISTKNIWWGPSQFNSLTFSNNAPGFPHVTINTTKPAKTFLGNFESQLLMGQLSSSKILPSQNDSLNNVYGKPIPYNSRYLNALMVSYQPKWVPNLELGFARTFQVYDSIPRETFFDWFPVFEPFQKSNFFENDNTVDFDGNGRDQQMVIFGDFRVPKAQLELYFEYGKRDHSLNWREFILNPEHARAYIFGFLKLVNLPHSIKKIQIRGEITHQQESINRIIRYSGSGGNISWQMHYQARGFTNFGQGLGVGIGQGANVQTLEVSLVESFNKVGVLFERLENDQGFYYRAFYKPNEVKPWIDLSLGFLFDRQFNNLLLSSKLQLIHARNYQWQLHPDSTPEFPKGQNLTSMMAQVSAIYFWNKKK